MATATTLKKSKFFKGKDRRNVWLIILTTILIIASLIFFVPPSEKINQGLDIQGGLSVVLKATNTDGSPTADSDMESSRAIIENRVNALGASEATVQIQGTDQILVQIPGIENPEEALKAIGRTGKLEFARLDSITDESVVSAIKGNNYGQNATVTDDFGNTFALDKSVSLPIKDGTYTPILTGSNISSVMIEKMSSSSGYPVGLKLDSQGTQAFAEATSELVSSHGQIVIILDNEVQSAPSVQSAITDGSVQITGNYSITEAKALQTILQSGSLPVSFEPQTSQVVGPTLGQGALASGVTVALIGLLIVIIYLFVFYKGLGTITAGAMAVFAVIYLGILGLLSALHLFSLSLAGIAGIVLTIGMAADSSILTVERFREEIRMGRTIKAASITGVKHAIQTSIDADLVTLVSALSLFFLASASVRGFGLTLALGIFCDILMMLVFKAPLIRLLAPRSISKNPSFWGVSDSLEASRLYSSDGQGILTSASMQENSLADDIDAEEVSAEIIDKPLKGRFIRKDINFLAYRKIFLTIACVLIAASFVVFGFRGLNFGIEFVGGSSCTFSQTGDITTQQVRDAFSEIGVNDAVIQTTSTNNEAGFLVRTPQTNSQQATENGLAVASILGLPTNSVQIDSIGPDWGASVVRSSLIAFLVSLVLIIIYIAIRFEYKMGIMAIVALLHDLILVMGIYALVGREVNPNTIAALLTILGYSLYDTVVVFHRINDNMKSESIKCSFMTMANHSINQVLLRTINTTLTSLIPVLAMLVFGSETLKDFAFAMVIGLICGSYSSIAIASPLYAMWKTREPRYAKLAKKYGSEVKLFSFGHLNPLEENVSDGKKLGDATSDINTFVQAEQSATFSASSESNIAVSADELRENMNKRKQASSNSVNKKMQKQGQQKRIKRPNKPKN